MVSSSGDEEVEDTDRKTHHRKERDDTEANEPVSLPPDTVVILAKIC